MCKLFGKNFFFGFMIMLLPVKYLSQHFLDERQVCVCGEPWPVNFQMESFLLKCLYECAVCLCVSIVVVYSTIEDSSDNLLSYLPNIITAQTLSFGGYVAELCVHVPCSPGC